MQKSLDQTFNISLTDHVRQTKTLLRRFAPVLVIGSVLALWQVVTMLAIYPAFIIPPPLVVAERFVEVLLDGRLWLHTQVTLSAVVAGLLIGTTIGAVLGYLIAKNPFLEHSLAPLIVGLQSTPIVAYAPLLVIWFGSGPTSKIVTSALIVFFPTLLSTVVGLRSVPQPLRDLMRSQRATGWQTFTLLEVPAAMPVLISGLKISATLAVIGAVVGEFISANAGLGFLITIARNQYDTPLVLVSVITLAVIARVLYGLVSLLERHVLAWQLRSQRS
ncbi:MAG: ABC transporter permease [Anaerolineaceae bacterium]|nr:ABC transporter permease [Anaerolineaceae bacterium]